MKTDCPTCGSLIELEDLAHMSGGGQYDGATEELASLRSRLAAAESALAPFAHPDLQRLLSGNVDGDESVVFIRGDAELKIGDFKRAALLAQPASEK